MKISFSPTQPKTNHTKTMLALGAGIAALATYVASHEATRDKIKNYVQDLKDQWKDVMKRTGAEIELDTEDVKKAAKKIVRKAKARVDRAQRDTSQKE